MQNRISRALIGLIALLAARAASAAVIMLGTPPGSNAGGSPVNAMAMVTTSANQITILLKNLQSNPTSVVQSVSGLQFTLSTGQTSGTLVSSSGIERTVADLGVYSDGAAAATGWALVTVGSSLKLDALAGANSPKHTIVGPPDSGNLYSSGNGSVTGDSHNPFMGESASFTIAVPGVTAASTISTAIFQFNTAGNTTVTATTVPEPAGFAAILLLQALARRRVWRD
jgi:hypothetical protein